MTQTRPFSRRAALALGLSATFFGTRVLAEPALARRRMVVIVCRGAMDGLSVAPPLHDSDYLALRGAVAITPDQAIKLDGDFGLHPKLANLARLVQAGQARIAPATAIPDRIRSHFEAQDLLETGGAHMYAAKTGWLNRALQAASPATLKALSVGSQEPLILRGPIQAQSWSPGGRSSAGTDRLAGVLQELYAHDELLGPALASGLGTESMAAEATGGAQVRAADYAGFAATTGKFLTAAGGPQIAVISLEGFDTHANQGAAIGQLAIRLERLDKVLSGLQTGLGPAWNDTVVLVVTEFGRTAKINGTGGTDHGTAFAMILAGGALKPGGIVGDWPGLGQGKLFEDRDLAPTLDVRQVFKGVLADHMGLSRQALDQTVFPDSAAAPAVSGLIRA